MKNKEYFAQFLTYDPETGVFASTGSYLKSHEGRPIGQLNKVNGYVYWSHRGKCYLLHRLAWLFMTGSWPEHEVDHKDRDKTNQRWSNLRAATRQDNMCNSLRAPRGLPKGVYLRKGRFLAQITRDRTPHYLGMFSTAEAAHDAYALAADAMHKEFARVA